MNFKKSTLLVAMLAITIGSCTKKYESNFPYEPPFHIDGIADVSVNENNSTFNSSMNLAVSYTNSIQERVTLSVEGLPAGVYATITNPSAYPTFSSFIQFTDSTGAVGSYKVNLVAKGDHTGKFTYPFNLVVAAVPDCASDFTGGTAYTAQNLCGTGSSYSESVTLLSPNHIQFTNFEDAGVHLNATLNCSSGQVTVPSQTINGFTYSGSGSFSSFGGNQQLDIQYFKQPVGGGSGTFCEEFLFR